MSPTGKSFRFVRACEWARRGEAVWASERRFDRAARAVLRENTCCFSSSCGETMPGGLSTKHVVFTLFLQDCPRTSLFSHWFYKIVREQWFFYIGFTKVVREKPYKTNVNIIFFVDNPPGMVSPEQEEEEQQQKSLTTALASRSNRLSLAHTASPRLARSHTRTKRNDFPVGGFTKGLPPPTSNKEYT